ncbi:class I SAM-dependent methyltransferase [Conexibacter arvalis]|uniref:SAM-dependent methyltransferase n=1 Tax=Conexibacter arvalis TaxID=912552 RepID=A0A840IFE1_9ACTN|nr:class I SAM-dependent methyltransferase [Conexibacter arvalis]MBB4663045.1 SAM-dependent methyltransferase [Conexibacter arvalis]
MSTDAHELNRASWNAATARHLTHRRDLARRLRDGDATLWPEERALLGDLAGRRVVHLQCNDGADTLGLAALGADALGVDISDVAVEAARALAAESGIAARFERADVLDWLPRAAARGERFDVVFASYGALPWISDLGAWARGAAGVLAPGGLLAVVEFHPLMYVFEEGWRVERPYFASAGGQRWEEGVEDYVGYSAGDGAGAGDGGTGESGDAAAARRWVNPNPCVEFQWTLGDVLSAVAAAGLRIERFEEHAHSNFWRPFPDMRGDGRGRWFPPRGRELPLMFSLAARAG